MRGQEAGLVRDEQRRVGLVVHAQQRLDVALLGKVRKWMSHSDSLPPIVSSYLSFLKATATRTSDSGVSVELSATTGTPGKFLRKSTIAWSSLPPMSRPLASEAGWLGTGTERDVRDREVSSPVIGQR